MFSHIPVRKFIITPIILACTLFACNSNNKTTDPPQVTLIDTSGNIKTIDPDPVLAKFKHAFADTLPAPTNYVNDYDSLFTGPQLDSLNQLLSSFEKRTGNEIAVVTFTGAMARKENLDHLILQLANAWGVGKKNRNNGILVGLCKDCKRIRIQNGYGIEKILTDSATEKIINDHFLPPFREGKFFTGTWNGINALMKKL